MLTTDEKTRLEVLRNLDVLDTPPEAAFERAVALAVRLFRVPIALVSLVDEQRQWFKACIGLDIRQTDRRVSFCAHTILGDGVFIVPDAMKDPRFMDNPLVTGEPGIRFYAGAPLTTVDGCKLGSLCVIDTVPREDFSLEDRCVLESLAATVMDALELRACAAQLRTAQLEVEAERDLLREIFIALEEGVVVLGADGRIIAANESAERVHGLTRDQLLGRNSLDLCWHATYSDGTPLPGEDHPVMVALREAKPVTDALMRIEQSDGRQVWLSVNARPILPVGQAKPTMAVASFFDITAHREATKRLEHVASHDVLTGLPNRVLFRARLDVALENLEKYGPETSAFAVAFVDLNGFKPVNDTFGHTCGDQLLRSVAGRLAGCTRSTDTVARFGGDEFTFLLPGIRNDDGVAQVTSKIARALEQPFEADGHTVHIGASIGWSLCPRDARTVDDLLSLADREMYRVKNLVTTQASARASN